jgi:hypothetical protein
MNNYQGNDESTADVIPAERLTHEEGETVQWNGRVEAIVRLSGAIVVVAATIAGMSCCGAGARPASSPAMPTSARCPSRVPRLTAPSDANPGTVVNQAATTLLLCRYAPTPEGLKRHIVKVRRVDGRTRVMALIRGLNSLPPFPNGSINCPGRFGDEIVILPLRDGRDIGTVDVELDMCFEVTNGVTYKSGLSREPRVKRVFRELERLVPSRPMISSNRVLSRKPT